MSDMSYSAQSEKEMGSAFERWQPTSFDPPATQSSVSHEAAEAALQPLRDAAYAQGLETGHATGEALGYQAGFEKGCALGYEAGCQEGSQKGFERGLDEARMQAHALANLAEAFKTALDSAHHEISESLVALALDIAQHIVREHISQHPEAILACIREALAHEPALTGAPHLVIHPSDLPIVETHLSEELHTLGWRVRTDAAIERGGCRVHAATGEIDATLATRWGQATKGEGRKTEGGVGQW